MGSPPCIPLLPWVPVFDASACTGSISPLLPSSFSEVLPQPRLQPRAESGLRCRAGRHEHGPVPPWVGYNSDRLLHHPGQCPFPLIWTPHGRIVFAANRADKLTYTFTGNAPTVRVRSSVSPTRCSRRTANGWPIRPMNPSGGKFTYGPIRVVIPNGKCQPPAGPTRCGRRYDRSCSTSLTIS